jgi:aspartyl-tRNA synthetase
MLRTHLSLDLNLDLVGQEVVLSGWVHKKRNLGDLIFIDLRDFYGITQLVFNPEQEDLKNLAQTLKSEWVIQVKGKIKKREEKNIRKEQLTGDLEIIVNKLEVLAESKLPPFEINREDKEVREELRLKYRYLDLRREKLKRNLVFRSKMNHFTRNWFTDNNFLEIQTPIFTVSSPEGARDYLIPSRIYQGKFYALPQAPQQYKQLLMAGGVDKYFQIAPCFRDEDPRSDRHSCEFYQLDVEMSFVQEEDVFEVVESYLKDLVKNVATDKKITVNSFQKLSFKDALNFYGSDKPDLRFGLKFEDLTDFFQKTNINFLQDIIKTGGKVKSIVIKSNELSRKQIDKYTELVKTKGLTGLLYWVLGEDQEKGPLTKLLNEEEKEFLKKSLNLKTGDTLLLGAGEEKKLCLAMGDLRLKLRDDFNLVNKKDLAFTWVTDFPIFAEEDGKLDFEHNPFSKPKTKKEDLTKINPLDILGYQYDLACNGYEVLSGSIRNSDPETLKKLFALVGKDEKEVKEKFGALSEAFTYGTPPHGGFAFGFDRLMMIFLEENNIRDMYAFPKTTNAQDLMMGAPSYIDTEQLAELKIQVKEN